MPRAIKSIDDVERVDALLNGEVVPNSVLPARAHPMGTNTIIRMLYMLPYQWWRSSDGGLIEVSHRLCIAPHRFARHICRWSIFCCPCAVWGSIFGGNPKILSEHNISVAWWLSWTPKNALTRILLTEERMTDLKGNSKEAGNNQTLFIFKDGQLWS